MQKSVRRKNSTINIKQLINQSIGTDILLFVQEGKGIDYFFSGYTKAGVEMGALINDFMQLE